MDTVVTELDEEAEEMEKMEKDKRNERNEEKQVSDRPNYIVLNLVALLQPKQGRSCQSQTTETWSSSSFSLVATDTKNLNNKVIEIIRNSTIRIRTESDIKLETIKS